MSMLRKSVVYLIITILLLVALSGCGNKVTTVADDITLASQEEMTVVEDIRLKDNGNGREEIGYCALMIPSDFVKSEEVEGMYVSTLYPLDSSNIYYSVEDSVSLGIVDDNLTKEEYEKAIEEAHAAVDEPIDLVIDSFEKEDMEGIPCFKIRSHFSLGERDIQQLVYIILAADTHVITYTQVSDDELLADFKTDEGQLRLVREVSQS